MFDEYVEHTSAPAVGHAVTLPAAVRYEGFEPSPYETYDEVDEVETQPEPSGAASPIFELGQVQYTLPARLLSLVVSSDVLAMGLSNNVIVLIELSRDDQVLQIQIPRKTTDLTIYKLFLDPSGRHIIITSTQGENWYLYRGWKKPRPLKSLKMVIESVAWNRAALLSSSTHSTSTREILIGSRNGTLHEAVLDAQEDFFKSQERYLQAVFTLPERHPITGLKFDYFPPSEPRKALVLVTTPTRIYQFVGSPERRSEDGGRVFSSLFARYNETAPKILELPGNVDHSELHVYTPKADQAQSLPKTLAWMTGPGIYHGSLNYDLNADDLVDGAQLLPYPTFPSSPASSPVNKVLGASNVPLSIALTEFHFIMLYRDRVVGVSTLNEQLTYEDILPLKPNEQVQGLAADSVRGTYWVYTDQSIFELDRKSEDRDVWRIYLEKQQFDAALQYAKTARQRDIVMSAQARAYFDEGRYFQAAQSYAQSSVSFEEVTLKFLDAGERDALRSYLIFRLERTKRTDVSQRMMLATWLVEFYLSKCNELDDLIASVSVSQDVANLEAERTILEEDLRHFFETYKDNLDSNVVYELIQGHGRTDMYLFYATVIGHHDRVIEHWIMEEEWLKAIDVLNRQVQLDMYYRYALVLVRQAPKETVDSWLRQPALEPRSLIPALLQLQHLPRDPLSANQAIRYLNHVIFEQGNITSTIHNLLITFHATTPSGEDDGPLLRFLTTAPSDPLTGKPYYDLDYALRICKQAGRIQPCVHIYAQMGLWESSIDLALEKGDLELARINANMPPDEDRPLRKRLWLKIAKYVIQEKQDIKLAIRFLDETDLLKIEDILPFFPDFVVIDDFKEEICDALEGYSSQIDALKAEMDETTRSADAIKQDISALEKRFITLDVEERCFVCRQLSLARQFYAFPCQHTFHADCLIGLMKEYLPASTLRRILGLQTELMKLAGQSMEGGTAPSRQPSSQRALLSAGFNAQNGTRAANSLGRNLLSAGDKLRDLIVPDALASVVTAPVGWIPGMGGTGKRNAENVPEKIEKLRKELEDVLAGSCPLCESVTVGLDKPFIKEGEIDNSWAI